MPVRRYLRGIGLSCVRTINDGMYHSCHQDEQGSAAYITGNAGAVENSYAYDAFGNVLEQKEGIENYILYMGQQYDQEAGQYYLRARFYNPVIGRFMQENTYRGDGLNLYAYCGNNPVMYYDPSGHDKETLSTTELESPRTGGEGGRDITSPNDNLITVYRGTSNGYEIAIYNETGRLMSDSARRSYMESGNIDQAYRISQEAHEQWIKIWGDENTYIQAHGEFGTELSQAFGIDRSMVSVTTDESIARRFAGDNGIVIEMQVPASELHPQTLSGAGECEYLIVNGTRG